MDDKSKRHRAPRQNLAGERFGKLVASEWAGNSRWRCLCDCGRVTSVLTANLRRGNTTSCGCIRNITSSKRATTHGLSGTAAYRSWLNIRRRCREVTHPSYPTYGAKGIDIHEPWYQSVEAFVRDVGHPPTDSHTLDRIENARGYEPGNVRWATPTQQARNRSVCRSVTFQGHAFPSVSAFIEWLAPQIGIKPKTLKREITRLP